MPKKKIGRPTDNIKSGRLDVRLDEESMSILEKYTKQEKVSKAETVRRGLKKLEGDIKK